MNQEMERICDVIRQEGIKNIYLLFTGLSGTVYSKTVSAAELLNNTHVSWMNGISVNGSLIDEFCGVDGADWMVIVPDPETFHMIPWIKEERQRAAVMLCSIRDFLFDTRSLVKKVFDEYKQSGYEPVVGPQFAYRLDVEGASGFYRDFPDSPGNRFNNEIVSFLMEAGIDIEYYLPYGEGTYRIDMVPDLLYRNADKLTICKYFIEAYAAKAKYRLLPTSGCVSEAPFHMSIWNKNKERNLFFDGADPLELSSTGYDFMAGILAEYPALQRILEFCGGAAGVYERGYSAERKRTLLQVPLYFNEKKKADRIGWSKRCVFQGGSFRGNHYLLIACIYAAGMQGIRKENRGGENQESVGENPVFQKLLGRELCAVIDRKAEGRKKEEAEYE